MKHLLPYDNEDEVQYMNRTILTVFTETFFVDQVSFKPEKDVRRLLITGTNTLNCWKGMYYSLFICICGIIKFNRVNRQY